MSVTLRPLSIVLLAVATLPAQRGGRGPSEFIEARNGSWFVDTSLPAPDAKSGKIDPSQTAVVKSASDKGHLSFLYVCDPDKSPKHQQFEETIFGHAEISLLLRGYQCGRIDLSKQDDGGGDLQKAAPLMIAFDTKGKEIARVAMPRLRARGNPVIALLERGGARHGKISLKAWAGEYRKFLNEYQVYEGRLKTLRGRMSRLGDSAADASERVALGREEEELERMREELMKREEQLNEAAAIPPRPDKAVRVGKRQRRGR